MPTPTRKGIFIVLLAMVLVVGVTVVPDIISEDLRAWCLSTFGEGYQGYLLGFFVVGSVVLLFLTTDIAQHLRPGAGNTPPDRSPGTPDPELVAKVRKYLTERYEHRLSQKMAGRQPVNLKILPSTTGTSKEGAENYITLLEEEVRAAIGDIFTRANGRLLLVGLPGSGKTTLVLQLALHLLERPGSSMPVVLNLATWRSEFKTLDEWLSKILPTELGATPGLAEQIRKSTPLVLLLDGLDELPEADRNSCLTAIGEYGADAGRQFLISSRIAEYTATKDAPVNAQVEVAPLTVEQVEMGLAATANIQPESRRLLNALKSDPLLRQAVENPFYLNTAQLLFSTGKNWSEFGFTATDVTGRQRELVDRFVENALERKVKEEYPADKARHWLSFLASRMTERNMVVFELRDLQYDWWRWRKIQLVLGGIVGGLVFGINIGLVFGLGIGLVFGLNIWLGIGSGIGPVLGLVGGLAFWLIIGFAMGLISKKARINTKDRINWSWSKYIKRLRKHLVYGLGIGLTIVLGLGLTIILGIGEIVEISDALVYGLGSGVVVGLGSGVISGLLQLLEDSSDILQITSPYHRFYASMKALHFSILQHLLLRYQLRQQGLLPPDFVQFLNELSLRHILEFDGDPTTGKGGGGWRFRHRILQDYFTAKYFADNASKGTLEELVEVHLHDNTWKEIFLLVAGMGPKADKLLLLMVKKNREFLREPVLNNLLETSTKALLPTKTNYTPEFRRAVFVFVSLEIANDHASGNNRALDRVLNLALDHTLLLALDLDLNSALGRTSIRILLHDLDLELDLLDALEHDLYHALERNIDFEMVNKKITLFINYLTGNLLIVQCLNSAAYFSKSTREYVLSMLLVPLTAEEKAAMGVKDE